MKKRRGLRFPRWLFLDPATVPLLILGTFIIVTLGSSKKTFVLEDRVFGAIGGDYSEYNYPVHSFGRVYPLRIKHFDNPNYKGPPVVIVHGMGSSDAYFWRMEGDIEVFQGFIYSDKRSVEGVGLAQGLVDLGYDVVTYTYPDSRHRPTEYQAYDLLRVIEWTKRTFVKKSVHLVGHSSGGLIIQYYLASGQKRGDNLFFEKPEGEDFRWDRRYDLYDYVVKRMKYGEDVEKAVLVATPNLGILKEGGKHYGSPALYQMTEGSELLAWIAEGRKKALRRHNQFPEIYVFAGIAYEDYMGESPLDFGDGMVSVESAVGDFDDDDRFKDNIRYFEKDHFEIVMDGEVISGLDKVLDDRGRLE
ncbi:MAG: alpha/beta hydrolase [bacterium]|nr:alpha/beta hydrolase [bacterium]